MWCSGSIFLFYSLLFDSEVRTGNQITSFIVFVQAVAQRVLYVSSPASYINHKPLASRLSSRRRFVHPPQNIFMLIFQKVVLHEKLYLIFINRSLPVHSTSWLLPFIDLFPELWDEEIIQGCLEKPCLCWSTISPKLPLTQSVFLDRAMDFCVWDTRSQILKSKHKMKMRYVKWNLNYLTEFHFLEVTSSPVKGFLKYFVLNCSLDWQVYWLQFGQYFARGPLVSAQGQISCIYLFMTTVMLPCAASLHTQLQDLFVKYITLRWQHFSAQSLTSYDSSPQPL
jgi:hypothetical protein